MLAQAEMESGDWQAADKVRLMMLTLTVCKPERRMAIGYMVNTRSLIVLSL